MILLSSKYFTALYHIIWEYKLIFIPICVFCGSSTIPFCWEYWDSMVSVLWRVNCYDLIFQMFQKVLLHNTESRRENIVFGAPQYSVLGSIIFNLYINDSMHVLINLSRFVCR